MKMFVLFFYSFVYIKLSILCVFVWTYEHDNAYICIHTNEHMFLTILRYFSSLLLALF